MLIERLVFAGSHPGDPIGAALDANQSLFSAAFLFSAVNSILALTVSFYMLQVYDRVLASRSLETLAFLTLIAAAALAVFGLLDMLRAQLLARIGIRVGEALGRPVLQACVAASLLRADPSVRQGLRDTDALRIFLSGPAFAGLMDAPFLLAFLLLLIFLHWSYFLIVLAAGMALAGIAFASDMTSGGPSARAVTGQIEAQSFADDGLRNAEMLEGMGMSAAFARRWRSRWLESQTHALTAADREAAWTGASKAVRQFTQVLLLGMGALLVLRFQATGGIMVAASIIGGRALAPIEQLVAARRTLQSVRLARRRLARLLEQAPAREAGMALPAPAGRLQAQAVAYLVPGSPRRILTNVSFVLEPGEALCIVGASGSGKSSLARLLVGALPCSGGVVRLDGADIHARPRSDLGRHVGYLPQDVELLAGTVRDNIARLTEAAPDAVVRAAQMAHAHNMILALPQGYDTEIGEAGHRLSGGERQRIALARALYGEPRLVVLDEPNANLDAAGEAALQDALATLKAHGVTVVLITHHQRMTAGVDKILTLRDGTMALFGPRLAVLHHMARAAMPPAAMEAAP